MSSLAAIEAALGSSASPRWRNLVAEQRPLWTPEAPSWLLAGDPHRPDALLAIANSREGVRRMREVLRAFFGPAQECVLLDDGVGFPEGVIVERLAVKDPIAAERALRTIIDVRLGHIREARQFGESIEQLLRMLHGALDAFRQTEAFRYLETIESAGLLSHENTWFLRIKVLAAFGRWGDIVALDYFDALTQSRAPVQTRSALLEALWHTNFADAGMLGNEQLRARFTELQLAVTYSTLFDSVRCPDTTAARVICALYCGQVGSATRLGALVREAPEAERSMLRERAGLTAPDGLGHLDIDSLRSEFHSGNYVAVVEALDGVVAPLEVVELLLKSALALRDPTIAARILGAENFNTIRQSRDLNIQALVRGVENLSLGATGWTVWATGLLTREWSLSRDAIRDFGSRWPIDFLAHPEQLRGFCDGLEAMLLSAGAVNLSDVRRQLLELLVACPQSDDGDRLERILTSTLVAFEWHDEETRRAVLRTIDGRRRAGLPVSNRLLSSIELLWNRSSPTQSIDWLVQCIDVITRASPGSSATRDVVRGVRHILESSARRLDNVWLSVLGSLSADCAEAVAGLAGTNTGDWRTGRRRRVVVSCRDIDLVPARRHLDLVAEREAFELLDETDVPEEEFSDVTLIRLWDSTQRTRSSEVVSDLRHIDAAVPSAVLAVLRSDWRT